MSILDFGKKPEQLAPKEPSTPPAPQKEQEKGEEKRGVLHGLDVSRYQTHVNWKRARELGYSFVIAKATDGAGGLDAMFESHMKGSGAEGFLRGAYCFNRFSSSPIAQADLFAKTAEKYTRLLVLDVEWDRSSSTKAKFGDKYGDGGKMDEAAAVHALTCLERLEALGFKPLIYSNTYFFLGFKNPERFARFPYWASNYQQKHNAVKDLDVSKVPLPKPYNQCLIWQWSDKSVHARAIVGEDNLDVNVFFGTEAGLRKWGAQ